MIVKKKKGTLLSATFSRKSPAIDAEIDAFTAELRKLQAKHPQFLVAENDKGEVLEVDVFPAQRSRDGKAQEDIATKKMTTMSPEQAAALIQQSAAPKEKKKASPLSGSKSRGAGFKR
jgi:hypothetical protein